MKRQHTGHKVGEWHGKATHDFATVQLSRTLHEQGATPKDIAEYLEVKYWTLQDWLQFKARVNA